MAYLWSKRTYNQLLDLAELLGGEREVAFIPILPNSSQYLFVGILGTSSYQTKETQEKLLGRTFRFTTNNVRKAVYQIIYSSF